MNGPTSGKRGLSAGSMGMECKALRDNLDRYRDEALDPVQQAAFESHLAGCPTCRTTVERAERLGLLLRAGLTPLAEMTAQERVTLREGVLAGLDPLSAKGAQRLQRLTWVPRLVGLAAVLAVALLAALILLPGGERNVSAAEIANRAWAAVDQHQGLHGVLHWEAEWSERFPSGDQITRTFEIWFDFDDPGRYRLIQRDPQGQIYHEMVRDGVDHMWQAARTTAEGEQDEVQVDQILLEPQEMAELSGWLVPSPSLDDLQRFTGILERVEKRAEIKVAGRPAYVVNGRLYGFGQPTSRGDIQPVTTTVQLVVDAETFWVLGRVERLPAAVEGESLAGVIQRTRLFEILPPEGVPEGAFSYTPPPDAQVRTVQGLSGYYAAQPDAIGLEEAARLTSFRLLLPTDLPPDLRARPFFRYQGPGPAATFGVLYLGDPGRQAFLIEYEQAGPMTRATRLVQVGSGQGWLAADPIDGRKFSLFLIDPGPALAADGRPWPGGVELQAWGLTVDEAAGMLASLSPFEAPSQGE
jgi:hypothetical protein